MKRLIYTILCTLLLVGCIDEQLIKEGNQGSGKNIIATFTLSPEFVEEIEVRSVTGVNEKVIKDLWVIQLNAAGTAQLQAPRYITSGFTSTGSDYKISLPLLSQASKIYFIANTHNASAYTTVMTTSSAVEAVAMTLTGEENLASADGIPMSGVWTGTPDLLGIAGRISLSRAIAKVNFSLGASLPIGEKFSLESVTVKQVPTSLQYYRTSLDNYPYPETPKVIDFQPINYAKVDLLTAPQSICWYLPENARGIGTATIQTDKAVKIPTGQAAYCTYLEVAGQYTLSPGVTYATTYRIYLGTNNTTDYNLKRNTIYNVNTILRGIDAADTRINTKEVTLDYTDNGKGWFVVAPVDAKNPSNGTDVMNWYLATGTYDATANPSTLGSTSFGEYKIPDHSQLFLLWIYKDALENNNFTTDVDKIYWSANLSPVDASKDALCMRLSNGHMYGGGKVSSNVYVRYIKETKDKKYPYVLNGTTIVSHDTEGGVKSQAIHPNWTTLPEHIAASSDNKVSAKLEIANSDVKNPSDNSKVTMNGYLAFGISHSTYNPSNLKACPDGWRLPTQRELQLIYVLYKRGDLNNITSMNNDYWSGTFAVVNSTVCYVGFNYGVTATPSIGQEYRVRCVRDVN